jgi:GTP-binding protein LepA
MSSASLIRNFCVISHIDHGKTTLTDRFLEITGAVNKSKLTQRLLDSNPIEQERGITIKLAPVRLTYRLNTNHYILNLIDTPGHVDFGYEVSRSLAACEGAILLVDATQGIQAQTLANAYKALDANLELVPVINKIDMPNAEIDKVAQELEEALGFKRDDLLFISAKTGEGVVQLIEEVIKRVPEPGGRGSFDQPLQALVFNSFYHLHKGVVAYVRLFAGSFRKNEPLMLMSNQHQLVAEDLGYFLPAMEPKSSLQAGEVGFLATGLKDIKLCRVGDTLTSVESPTAKALPGYQEPNPMVFMDLYPVDNDEFIRLKTAMEKLQLSDSSLSFNAVSSPVLGSGFKVGFQGLLHADIVQERLEREFDLNLITTSPSVEYQVELRKNQQVISVFSPSELPDPTLINQIREPFIKAEVFAPKTYLGAIMALCQNSRGTLTDQQYFGSQVKLTYHLPLSELVGGFFNQLKSISSGFASLEWTFLEFRAADIVKLEVMLNRERIDPLAMLTVRSRADQLAKLVAAKLKTAIPRQQYEVPIQIALGGKILARETVKAFRKDVTAKLYGGDRTRAMKLLEKQKKGKKRLKQVGGIELPQEVFLTILQQ